jgi:RNA polymerase sigma-70 factor (ECF subfamily)
MALLRRAREGDVGAFERLVYRFDRQVLSIAARYFHRSEDAKDAYQEVFIRAYRGLGTFREESEFATWLFRIATNVCLTFRTHRSKQQLVWLDDEAALQVHSFASDAHAASSPEQHTTRTEIATRVQQALDTLSPQQRLVFTLKHNDGYKLREIAAMMNCSEGTVKKHLFVATRRLRVQLKDFARSELTP